MIFLVSNVAADLASHGMNTDKSGWLLHHECSEIPSMVPMEAPLC